MSAQLIGIDTGFFFSLQEGNTEAIGVMNSDATLISSTVVLSEVLRHIIRGRVASELSNLLKEAIVWVPVKEGEAEEAARISHGTGMPLVDSLILASLLRGGCSVIYTTDGHLESFGKKGLNIVNLRKQAKE
ncbi:MAG: type II toxin-antitoxin system VapC family toxin [Deltaproteobacteria bacterium]|nr:type II toxin-antitoxin system VapC family toxin [Deltaproteobacteria bacterium]